MTGIFEKGAITLEDLIELIRKKSNIDRAGAIVTFTGIVRREKEDGKQVKRLKIDSYKEMAEKILNKITNEEKKDGIIDIQIAHLIGDFSTGEDLVYVVIMGAHRQECFQTLERVVDRYKNEAPFWKKEILETGEEFWISKHNKDKK